MEVLKEFEELFDETIGDWNTKPVSFEFEGGANTHHCRPFPVQRVHKDTIVKELNRLCIWECWSFSPHQNGQRPPILDIRKIKLYELYLRDAVAQPVKIGDCWTSTRPRSVSRMTCRGSCAPSACTVPGQFWSLHTCPALRPRHYKNLSRLSTEFL